MSDVKNISNAANESDWNGVVGLGKKKTQRPYFQDELGLIVLPDLIGNYTEGLMRLNNIDPDGCDYIASHGSGDETNNRDAIAFWVSSKEFEYDCDHGDEYLFVEAFADFILHDKELVSVAMALCQ